MRKDIYDLSGGQNNQVTPLLLRENQCEIVQNYKMDKVGSLTKRNGITYLLTQIVNNKSVLGMYYFNDKIGTDRSNVLVVIDDATSTNSDIFAIETNAWAISKTNDTAGALPVFTTFVDYVFRTNGADVMGSSADPRPTGGAWGTTNCLATLLPRYCCVWEDRLYWLNDNSATAYPSRIGWSELPTGAPLALTFGANNWADINPDDNDEITWGEPFGRVMLIFKENAIYHWTFGQVEPDKIIDVGTPQGLTVKKTHGICFFANKYGVWAHTGQSQPRLISRKVQPFIDAIPTLTAMRAEVDNDHYYLYIGDVTVDGVAYANVMLVYTISLDAWHFETYPFEITAMARFIDNTLGTTAIYDSIYLGDDDGYVYRKDVGTVDYLGTTAQPINGYFRTKEYPLNFPNTSKLNQLYVIANKASGTQVNYRIDRAEEFKPWHDLKERITAEKLGGRAKTIQFTFTDNSRTTSRIEGLSVDYTVEEEKRRETEKKRKL